MGVVRRRLRVFSSIEGPSAGHRELRGDQTRHPGGLFTLRAIPWAFAYPTKLLPAVPNLVLSADFINSLPAPLQVLNEDVK